MSLIKTVKGITFQFGENESQIYWEHVAEKKTYILLQPKALPTYWAIIQFDEKRNCKPLNCAIIDKEGNVIQKDPLHCFDELTVDGWLDKLADYIREQDY